MTAVHEPLGLGGGSQPSDASDQEGRSDWLDPHASLSLALVISLLLWAPFGLAALREEIDILDALLRYAVAFAGCRLAVSGIVRLVSSYQSEDPAPAGGDDLR